MKWSFQNDAPIYAQLIEQIKSGVATGAFAPGDRLPSVRDMAAEAGVNPNTMQRALAQLEAEGLLFSQRTAGRFVTQDQQRINEAKRELAKRHMDVFLGAMERLGLGEEETLALVRQAQERRKKADECPYM